MGGSRLEAKATQATGQPYSWCYKDHDWFNVWLVFHKLVPVAKGCLLYYLNVTYEADGLHNSPGMEVPREGRNT